VLTHLPFINCFLFIFNYFTQSNHHVWQVLVSLLTGRTVRIGLLGGSISAERGIPEVCVCVFACVCLSVCLADCLSACLPACLPACLSVCLSVCQPACLPACLPATRYSKDVCAFYTTQ
jgi:hypothetical protein